jgi:GNAT superfamily N-acetyltransferase
MHALALPCAVAVSVEPATADRFDDVALVLGPKKPTSSVCWCLSHRVDSRTNASLVGPERGAFVRRLCERDVAPRGAGLRGRRRRRLGGRGAPVRAAVRPLDEDPARRRPAGVVAWCVRVRPGHRGKGVAQPLLEGAAQYAASQGAPAVEGYPVDNRGAKVDLTMAYVGTRVLFERAGFTWAADTTAVSGGFPRVVMRRDLR